MFGGNRANGTPTHVNKKHTLSVNNIKWLRVEIQEGKQSGRSKLNESTQKSVHVEKRKQEILLKIHITTSS